MKVRYYVFSLGGGIMDIIKHFVLRFFHREASPAYDPNGSLNLDAVDPTPETPIDRADLS